MNFASDNVYGVHPEILKALSGVNGATATPYGGDSYTRKAEERLCEVFEKEVKVYLVTTGTAANGLALSAISPGHGAILAHGEAHVFCDECNAPEFFTGGAKILGLHGPGGKLTPTMIEKTLKGFIRGEHDPMPKGVSIANATELGTVYTPAEVKVIAAFVRPLGMKFHMDGARFANAVASLGVKPADITWKAGVDVMSFGATKNGAMLLEAVVFFDPSLANEFGYRRMRSGQLVSKSRYLGAQMLAYLENDLWLENARRANDLARKLAIGLRRFASIRIPSPVEANEVFAVMPKLLFDRLRASGAVFHDWMPDSLGDGIGPDEVFARFVTSFATPEDSVPKLLSLMAETEKQ